MPISRVQNTGHAHYEGKTHGMEKRLTVMLVGALLPDRFKSMCFVLLDEALLVVKNACELMITARAREVPS